MTRRRLRKIITLSVLVTILLIGALVTIVALELPSINEIQASFPAIQKPVRAPASYSGGVSTFGDLNPTDIREGGQAAPRLDRAQEDLISNYLVGRYIEDAATDVRVCENLTEIQDPPIRDRASLTNSISRLASGEARENPFPEAVLAPIGYVLRRPAVGQLAQQLLAVRATGNDQLINRSDLNGQLASASADLFANKTDLERVSQEAYHLFVISRVVQERPDLATNPETAALCTQIEGAIEQPSDANQPIDLNKEKAAILRFLAFARMSPDQAGYDPNLSAQIAFSATPQRIVLKVPWMDKVFGGLPEISTPGANQTPSPP